VQVNSALLGASRLREMPTVAAARANRFPGTIPVYGVVGANHCNHRAAVTFPQNALQPAEQDLRVSNPNPGHPKTAMQDDAGTELERTLIISRTNDGRVAPKARGVAFGRPRKCDGTSSKWPGNSSATGSRSAPSPGPSTFTPRRFTASSRDSGLMLFLCSSQPHRPNAPQPHGADSGQPDFDLHEQRRRPPREPRASFPKWGISAIVSSGQVNALPPAVSRDPSEPDALFGAATNGG
jgi:hypothetical protein